MSSAAAAGGRVISSAGRQVTVTTLGGDWFGCVICCSYYDVTLQITPDMQNRAAAVCSWSSVSLNSIKFSLSFLTVLQRDVSFSLSIINKDLNHSMLYT